MALFSRRKPVPAAEEAAGAEAGIAADASTVDAAAAQAPSTEASGAPDAPGAPDATAAPEVTQEPVPEVSISVSTFGKPSAGSRPIDSVGQEPPAQPATPAASGPRARPAAEAPARTETVSGLPDNTVLKQALASLPETPGNAEVMNVMRQALQGHLYVRAQGNAQDLIAQGASLTLAITSFQDKRFLLAYTGGAALQASIRADGDTATSAVGQPAIHILRNVTASGYDGLYLDHAIAGARMILPTQLIAKALDEGDPELTIKTLLVSERTQQTAFAVAEALTRVKLWVAAKPDPASGQIGLAEARTPSGQRRLEVFSHPLEVVALGRGDRALPITGAQLGKALAADTGMTGLLIDPAGPWIELDREALAPVLALADQDASGPESA